MDNGLKIVPAVMLVLVASISEIFSSTAHEANTPHIYTISTLSELQDINNDLAGIYHLANDIDASDTVNWNGGEGFFPIGNVAHPFTGQFDGQFHAIHNLFINRPGGDQQALFGRVVTPPGAIERAVIKNVRLIDADVTAGAHSGTLIGYDEYTDVYTCGATGNLTVRPNDYSDAKSGGLIGSGGRGSNIAQCFSEVIVDGGNRKQVGGLVGYLRGVEAITRLKKSYSRREVIGTGSKQGNLVGDADGSVVDRCYSSGSGKALIGFNFRDPVITRSYWDSDTGPASSPYGGTPKTTTEMMTQSTYMDWDFDSIWEIDGSYPQFQTTVPVDLMNFTIE